MDSIILIKPFISSLDLFTIFKMRFILASAMVAALTSTVLAVPTDMIERQSTVRITALGDSITGSPVQISLIEGDDFG